MRHRRRSEFTAWRQAHEAFEQVRVTALKSNEVLWAHAETITRATAVLLHADMLRHAVVEVLDGDPREAQACAARIELRRVLGAFDRFMVTYPRGGADDASTTAESTTDGAT